MFTCFSNEINILAIYITLRNATRALRTEECEQNCSINYILFQHSISTQQGNPIFIHYSHSSICAKWDISPFYPFTCFPNTFIHLGSRLRAYNFHFSFLKFILSLISEPFFFLSNNSSQYLVRILLRAAKLWLSSSWKQSGRIFCQSLLLYRFLQLRVSSPRITESKVTQCFCTWRDFLLSLLQHTFLH